MARREGGMSGGPMNTIIGGFIGLLVIIAIVILGPVLAGSIEKSVPAQAADSRWNDTTRAALNLTALPNGAEMWTTNVTIGGVVILVFFIALAIYYIRIIA